MIDLFELDDNERTELLTAPRTRSTTLRAADVTDDFYGMVGRVAMLSTLVEDKLLELTWALDQEHTQDKHAGQVSDRLIKLCRQLLLRFPTIETLG